MKKTIKNSLSTIIFFIACLGLGFILGQLMGTEEVSQQLPDISLWQFFILSAITAILQIAIHEAGHVVAGLLTGYKFLSYRLFNLLWQKRDGQLHFSLYSLPGTAGQALMIPPQPIDGKIPYVLYNLGGGLGNLLTVPLAYLLLKAVPTWTALWILLLFYGLLFGLTNLIPLSASIPNDGYNIKSIARHPQGSLYFWSQLAINAQLADGQSYREMEASLFLDPKIAELDNPIIFSAVLGRFNRLMSQERYAEARAYLEGLGSDQLKLPQLYQVLTKTMLAYAQMLTDQACSVDFDNNDWKLITALSKSQPSVLVFQAAYYSLIEPHQKKVTTALTQFDKLGKNYPYPAEYQEEKDRWEKGFLPLIAAKKQAT